MNVQIGHFLHVWLKETGIGHPLFVGVFKSIFPVTRTNLFSFTTPNIEYSLSNFTVTTCHRSNVLLNLFEVNLINFLLNPRISSLMLNRRNIVFMKRIIRTNFSMSHSLIILIGRNLVSLFKIVNNTLFYAWFVSYRFSILHSKFQIYFTF